MDKRKGIDVSTHQGVINFEKVANTDIEYMIPRCGFATRRDNMFFRNVELAVKHGIEIPGVYLFSYALNAKDAIEEALFAINMVERAGLPKTTIIFFDLEYDTLRYAKQKGVVIGKRECMAHTLAFCDEVEKHGYKAGVYYNLDYYRNMYEPELLNKYVRWLADWTGGPDLPCEYHQYTSKGRVRGIEGYVDLNLTELGTDEKDPVVKTPLGIVDEILKGHLGNGEERKNKIEELGYIYNEIQDIVNDYVKIAEEVIEGKWSNGEQRKDLLEDYGYNYQIIQDHVNRLLE